MTEVLACPECDSASTRTVKHADYDYYCVDCGARIDDHEIVRRQAHRPTTDGRRGLANRLEKLNAEDVGPDVMTDGGTGAIDHDLCADCLEQFVRELENEDLGDFEEVA